MQIYTDIPSNPNVAVSKGSQLTDIDKQQILYNDGDEELGLPPVSEIFVEIQDQTETDEAKAGRIFILQRQGRPETLEVQHFGKMTEYMTNTFVEIAVKSSIKDITRVIFKPADGNQVATLKPFETDKPREVIRRLKVEGQEVFIVYPNNEKPSWALEFLITMMAKTNGVKLQVGDYSTAYSTL